MVKNYSTSENKFLQNTLHLILFKEKNIIRNWIKLIVIKKACSPRLSKNVIQQIWSRKKPRVKEKKLTKLQTHLFLNLLLLRFQI